MLPYRSIGLVAQTVDEGQIARAIEAPRLHQRERILQQPQPLESVELRERAPDALQVPVVVLHAEISRVADVRADRAAAAETHFRRGRAQEDGAPRIARVGEDHRNIPCKRRRGGIVQCEAFLRQRDHGTIAVASLRELDHGIAGLLGPARRQRLDVASRGLRQMPPQVGGGGIGECVLPHVAPDALPENALAEIALQHADESLALPVSDAVENVHRARIVCHRSLDRVRHPAPILRHRHVLEERAALRRAPFRVKPLRGPRRHPRSETFVQP